MVTCTTRSLSWGYDAARGAVLKGAGFQILRIANRDVTRDDLERLLRAALKNSHCVPLSGTERGSGGEDPERRGGQGDPRGSRRVAARAQNHFRIAQLEQLAHRGALVRRACVVRTRDAVAHPIA